jgi:hypothetical protein
VEFRIPLQAGYTVYTAPYIMRAIKWRRNRWAEEMRNAYKVSVGKPEEKRLHRRPRCK